MKLSTRSTKFNMLQLLGFLIIKTYGNQYITKLLTFGSTFIEENKCLMELVGHIKSRDGAFFTPVLTGW